MNTGERRNDLTFFLFLTEETFIKNPVVPVGSHLLLPPTLCSESTFPDFLCREGVSDSGRHQHPCLCAHGQSTFVGLIFIHIPWSQCYGHGWGIERTHPSSQSCEVLERAPDLQTPGPHCCLDYGSTTHPYVFDRREENTKSQESFLHLKFAPKIQLN